MKNFYPINQNIREPELRVLGLEGENLGVMSKGDAIKEARKRGLDLLVVTTKTTPPVAKILDFRKFLYEEKKESLSRKKSNKGKEPKTLRVGPNIDENDLKTRVERAKDFLADERPVRFEMLFKGRSITHPEFGIEKLERIQKLLSENTKVEKNIERKGRFATMVLGPK